MRDFFENLWNDILDEGLKDIVNFSESILPQEIQENSASLRNYEKNMDQKLLYQIFRFIFLEESDRH